MKNQHTNHVLELITGMLFISTSGALGKYIDLAPPVIIWFRSALAMFFLFFYCRFRKIDLRIKSEKDMARFALNSLLLGTHWVTYFYALKLSNVALGMLSLFTYPVIIALLEPLFAKTKLEVIHIILALIVLLGIYILAPEFDLENSHLKGILLGLVSAVFYGLRIILVKQDVAKYNGTMVMFYQLVGISIVLIPVLFFMDISAIATEFPFVLILALVTTAIGHTMFVQSLKYFSATTAGIISSVQPVFGIIIAFIFLSETPTTNTFIGGSLILVTVVIESLRTRK